MFKDKTGYCSVLTMINFLSMRTIKQSDLLNLILLILNMLLVTHFQLKIMDSRMELVQM